MSRVRFVAAAAVAAVVVVVGAVLLVPSAAGGSGKTMSPGEIEVDGTSSVKIAVYNPTDKDFGAVATLDDATGFDFFTAANLLVPAHSTSTVSFSCANTGSCTAVPIVTAPSKAIPSVRFFAPTLASNPTLHHAFGGDWRIA